MKVNFGEIIPISTIDWHGKASVVLFLRGCPYRCPYCQNFEILQGSDHVDVKLLEEKIDDSSMFVSSVVFSGGEPLVQKNAVMHLAGYAKKKGLNVGVHTNGYYPDVMEELIDAGVVDKFFIDVKAPLDDACLYAKATGHGQYPGVPEPFVVIENVRKSIALVTEREVEHELRTTVIRGFLGGREDVGNISRTIAPFVSVSDAPYVIQQGIPDHSMDESLRGIVPYSHEEMLELAKAAHKYVGNVWIRTRECGNEKVNFEND